MSDKLPAFQFYPADWSKDPNVRRCRKAEKGMWIDMLCLMHECEERGFLISASEPWTDDEIAEAVGGDKTENLLLLGGLLAKGVARRDQRGAVYNARMARDEHKRKLCAAAGKKGGGSPTFKGHTKGDIKGRLKGVGDRNRPPSSSSSTSSSKEENNTGPKGFSKPTLADVSEYCRERNNTVDPLQWMAFYESNGWKVGRNPMRNWKAAVITWEKNSKGGVNGSHRSRSRAEQLDADAREFVNGDG